MQNVKQILDSISSEIFTVVFTKKDGTERVMNCRKGVTKYLRGGESTTAHIDNLITVYDMKSKGYRNINTDTIKEVRANGQVYIG